MTDHRPDTSEAPLTPPAHQSIMIVDDNPNNLRVLSEMLENAGYRLRPALSGEIALRSIALDPPDLILLDIRMPGLDGYELCKRLKAQENTREIPIIFISALQDAQDKVRAFQSGGVDYITKPFQLEEVLARIRTHLTLYTMQKHLGRLVEERTRALQETLTALQEREEQYHNSLLQTIEAISLTIEKRDPYTAGHQRRVAKLAVAIARKLEWSVDRQEGLRLGASIHDIGKINIPAEILSKPGRLSSLEMALVRAHTEIGYEIVRGIDLPWPVGDMILQHHERLDGSGYPRGLKGGEIRGESRILMVADVVEAMASHRPYRPALGIETALQEIQGGRGERYDPEVVDACASLFRSGQSPLEPLVEPGFVRR